jgi:hypothetical protein
VLLQLLHTLQYTQPQDQAWQLQASKSNRHSIGQALLLVTIVDSTQPRNFSNDTPWHCMHTPAVPP